MRNEVNVLNLDKNFVGIERGIKNAALFFLEKLKRNNSCVDVFIISGQKMRSINRKIRGKDSTANVLAFDDPSGFPSPESRSDKLGEIYLCPSYINSHGEDINYMLLHGILHLLGFNHKNKSDRIRMEKIELDLISKWLNNRS